MEKTKLDNFKNKVKSNFVEGLKYYVVDTTGLLTVSTPIFAAMETFASGMSSETSLESRLKVAEISYLGLALLYTKGRDLSKHILKITDYSSKKLQVAHDSVYTALFNIAMSVPIYLSSGADVEQTIKGTTGAVIFSLVAGPINGFGVDMYRDFTGIKPSSRLPKIMRELNPKVKKSLAVGLIAASIGLTSLVYDAKDAYVNYRKNKKSMELKSPQTFDSEKDSAYVASF